MQYKNGSNTENAKESMTGIILLAAGLSKRLGKPKQLLQYKGQSLLQNAVQTALASGAQPVMVVLGARAEELKKEVQDSNIQVVINNEWEEGMASSIRCGVRALVASNPAINGTILMVCDQPFVTASLLNDLITAHQKSGKPVVACSYANSCKGQRSGL